MGVWHKVIVLQSSVRTHKDLPCLADARALTRVRRVSVRACDHPEGSTPTCPVVVLLFVWSMAQSVKPLIDFIRGSKEGNPPLALYSELRREHETVAEDTVLQSLFGQHVVTVEILHPPGIVREDHDVPVLNLRDPPEPSNVVVWSLCLEN
ncbi:hypothetical protein NDU88_002896 [Pleurodeles waltl]|uniref:Uncharacterized protein n=1 Tax=Pleurodeles waltl TaxID=8319 RepID=A0AAV7LDN6_PLEWA|nr:hypothetical protein NDU88_002896 [Pleurodeles waltl]